MVLQLRIPLPDYEGGGGKCVLPPGEDIADYDVHFEEPELGLAICNGTYDSKVCPMRHQCLMFALVNNETWGVWGGTVPEQRTHLRRRVPRSKWRFENAPSFHWDETGVVRLELDDNDDNTPSYRPSRRSRGDEEDRDTAAG